MDVMTVKEVIAVLRMVGFTIEREGENLGVGPLERVSPQMQDYLRQHKAVIIRALKLGDGEYLPGNLIHPLLAFGDNWWREIPPPDDVPPEAHRNKKHWFKSMQGKIASIG